MLSRLVVFVVFVVLSAGSLRASGLFEATATLGPTTVTSQSSTFAEMVESVVRMAFRSLPRNPGPFNATVTYMGIPSGFTVTPGIEGRMATLRLSCVGFSRTFTGTSTGMLAKKVRQFLLAEGETIAAEYRRALATQSALAVTDGNPSSATASAARNIFFSQGVGLGRTDEDPASRSIFDASSLSFSRGHIEADIAGRTYRGEQLRAEAMLVSVPINRRLRIELPFTGEFTTIEGTEISGAGALLAAPTRVIIPSSVESFGLKLVPVIGLHARASYDAAAGGVSLHGGLVSVADWRFNDRFVLSMINQVTHHNDVALEIGRYPLDSDINQTILKNGFSLTARVSPDLHTKLYALDTRFLKEAAVKSYYTAGISLDYRTSRNLAISAGVESDFADNYHSLLGRLQFNWSW